MSETIYIKIDNTTSDSNPFSFFSDQNGTIQIDINNYNLYTANSYKFQVIEVIGDAYSYAFKITNSSSSGRGGNSPNNSTSTLTFTPDNQSQNSEIGLSSSLDNFTISFDPTFSQSQIYYYAQKNGIYNHLNNNLKIGDHKISVIQGSEPEPDPEPEPEPEPEPDTGLADFQVEGNYDKLNSRVNITVTNVGNIVSTGDGESDWRQIIEVSPNISESQSIQNMPKGTPFHVLNENIETYYPKNVVNSTTFLQNNPGGITISNPEGQDTTYSYNIVSSDDFYIKTNPLLQPNHSFTLSIPIDNNTFSPGTYMFLADNNILNYPHGDTSEIVELKLVLIYQFVEIIVKMDFLQPLQQLLRP